MPSQVFLVNVPWAITRSRLEDWLDRFPPHAVSWAIWRHERCAQIEATTVVEANRIACALQSLYIPAGPLEVIRGETKEGETLAHLFA